MAAIGSQFENLRRAEPIAAEKQAERLFDAIEDAGLIRPNRTEREVEDDIYTLALHEFGVKQHWHKRIVRAGSNTVTIASETPPIRSIGLDDVVYVDLGPVFEAWEADIGRAYALGNHPAKVSLVSDLKRVFERVQQHYRDSPDIIGAARYAFAQSAASEAGWLFSGAIAGHLVSEFPHAHIPADKELNRIGPKNRKPMREPDERGRKRYGILEIHLVDHARTSGGLCERLLWPMPIPAPATPLRSGPEVAV